MKIFIVCALFAIVLAVNAADDAKVKQDKLIDEHLKKCVSKFPISDAQLALVKESKIDESNETVRCMVNCFWEESGIIKDGKVNEEKLINELKVKATEEKVVAAVAKCNKSVKIDDAKKCNAATQMHICLHNELGVF